jgi:hypothetical protein
MSSYRARESAKDEASSPHQGAGVDRVMTPEDESCLPSQTRFQTRSP